VLLGVSGCERGVRHASNGWGFETDGIQYHVSWHRGGVERQGHFDLSFLAVYFDNPMTIAYGSHRGKVFVPMHPDCEKVVAKTETIYFIKDKKIVLEKKYQELGIDASRLSADQNEMREYLLPILENLIREHIRPQEPEMEEEQGQQEND